MSARISGTGIATPSPRPRSGRCAERALDRRALLAGSIALLAPACTAGTSDAAPVPNEFAELEARAGGRLGVHALDSATGKGFGWRDGERFAHCSSFKLSLAALVLDGARKGRWRLDRRLSWTAAEVLGNSPVSGPATATGLDALALAEAAVVQSDNTAANALLRLTGGPQALTAWWRTLGDRVSRLDRNEPALNQVAPGTLHDTTTPLAMALTTARIVAGPALHADDRDLLLRWMRETRTGLNRLRAGFPAGWDAGDKTGTNPSPPSPWYVDLGFLVPPGHAPLVIAAYYAPARGSDGTDPAAEAVIAQAARLCLRRWGLA